MAMPDLTTLERVKAYLRAEIGANGEEVLNDFIVIASSLVRKHTKRRFTSPRVTETREYHSYGRSVVHIDEVFSAADITAVKDQAGLDVLCELDFGGDPEPYGVDLEPRSLAMVYGVQGLPPQHNDNFIRELRGDAANDLPEKILVTATFGYGENAELEPLYPPEIEFAARQAVSIWWKEEVAHYSEDAFISRGRIFEPEDLPPVVRGKLRKAVNEIEVAV